MPKYDNRYFGSIVETFETMARERGLFPIITCTRRDPELEVEAARTMLSYQVEWLVSTGATDPDRISDLCTAAGVGSLNLDLPGTKAPSIISDNFSGARELTRRILLNSRARLGEARPLLFIGGRARDHNTSERIRGFRSAHADIEVPVEEHHILASGYAPEKAAASLALLAAQEGSVPEGMFVNSTISLEGVMRWIKQSGRYAHRKPVIGCFDWDPFAALLGDDVEMVRQDVQRMLDAVFAIIDNGSADKALIEIPAIFRENFIA
ncbi:LacI family transcriptional regulator [Rhizobium sp. Leaf384]|uniref:LacI family transcriptional regulator n=1 Tax=Rhizobium sp. Leaf384 TaxID=1736358 RepID=UPI000AEC0A87